MELRAFDRSNSDDSLTIALSVDTEGGIISLAASHHCSLIEVQLIQGIQVKFRTRASPGGQQDDPGEVEL